MNKPILILGATSGIAQAVAERLATEKNDLILAGRDQEELTRTANDLQIRHGVTVVARRFEALDFGSHASFFTDCLNACNGLLHGVVLCHGYMASQAKAQEVFDEAQRMIDVNFTSAVSILNVIANYLEGQKAGFICAISSVAGDRGRQSNYIYGSTKAALNTYLEGLRVRLAKVGVPVTIVKPGFVDTRMTRGQPGMFLVAKPETVPGIFAGRFAGAPTSSTPLGSGVES